jgi:serine/threonine protein kinase
MERVDGTSIDKTLTLFAEQVTVGWLLDLLKGVAAGLDHLHQQGIIHRDIKPDNIFVDAPRSAAKIGDLGIALTEEEIKATGVHDSYGTPGFVAPEQILGLRLDSAADVYSLAVTIYTLLTRKGPFNVVDARSLLYAHVHLSPVPLTMRNASWPVALERVLLQSLSKNPLERHPTATALVAEAARALDAYTPIRLATYFDGRFSSGEVSVSLYRPAG